MIEFRKKCFEHHDRACWICGEPEQEGRKRSNIVVHHICGEYAARHDIRNLVPLCNTCHGKVHGKTPFGGDIEKLQVVLWEGSPTRERVCALGEFIFEVGELRFDKGRDTSENERYNSYTEAELKRADRNE